ASTDQRVGPVERATRLRASRDADALRGGARGGAQPAPNVVRARAGEDVERDRPTDLRKRPRSQTIRSRDVDEGHVDLHPGVEVGREAPLRIPKRLGDTVLRIAAERIGVDAEAVVAQLEEARAEERVAAGEKVQPVLDAHVDVRLVAANVDRAA